MEGERTPFLWGGGGDMSWAAATILLECRTSPNVKANMPQKDERAWVWRNSNKNN